ncbi:hypothetical protein ABLE68_17255 [Nocardioides sp. CN2-186]|uniref:hypothetical protein n=1 Tax=Nocardioides tweenelious TaxID=3156607 RepID=UPI0032B36252
MRIRRQLTALLVTALAATGVGVITTAAPADAAVPTRIVLQVSHPKAHYGDKLSISGQVQGQQTDGTWASVPTGTATLQFSPKSGSQWKSMGTDDSAGSFYFYPKKATKTGSFRVVYSGGTYGDYEFTPRTSMGKSVKVFRDLNDKLTRPGNRIVLKGKVSPKYSKKAIIVERRTSKHGKWKKFKKIRTNKKSQWSVQLPAPRRGDWYFRAFTPKSGGFQKSPSNYIYTTYRL